jgi:hypothetical protein
MRKLIFFAVVAVAIALLAVPAAASPPGSNGRIVFARFDPALGDDFVYTANPMGANPHGERVCAVEAEGEGFEPSSDLTARNGFRDRRIRPLCHPSTEPCGCVLRLAAMRFRVPPR